MLFDIFCSIKNSLGLNDSNLLTLIPLNEVDFNISKNAGPAPCSGLGLYPIKRFCDLVRIQTLNLHSRNVVLYSVELRSQVY